MTQPTAVTNEVRIGPIIQAYGPNGELLPFVANGVILLNPDGSIPASAPQTNTEFIAALKSGTATHSSVNSGVASVTILASNANRKGARIRNSDANALYLDLTGGTATVDRAQVTLAQNESYAVDAGYTGAITGIWAADGSGVASIAEFT